MLQHFFFNYFLRNEKVAIFASHIVFNFFMFLQYSAISNVVAH